LIFFVLFLFSFSASLGVFFFSIKTTDGIVGGKLEQTQVARLTGGQAVHVVVCEGLLHIFTTHNLTLFFLISSTPSAPCDTQRRHDPKNYLNVQEITKHELKSTKTQRTPIFRRKKRRLTLKNLTNY